MENDDYRERKKKARGDKICMTKVIMFKMIVTNKGILPQKEET